MENKSSTGIVQVDQTWPIPINIKSKEKTLIIGEGEIGIALKKVLTSAYEVHSRDKEEIGNDSHYRVINICFPYSKDFVKQVREYAEKYTPQLIIIHSTIPVGTTRQIENSVHSPVNGKHPDLVPGIRTFIKVVGAPRGDLAYLAVNYLKPAGINPFVFSSPETTELAKILCTTYLGWNVIFMKEVEQICRELNLPFHEVYTEWNGFYNAGYSLLGEMRFIRPVLFPQAGPIGGHCVIPNCDLLDSFITKVVKERNQIYANGHKTSKRNLASRVISNSDKQHWKGKRNSQPRLDRRGRNNRK